jgi:hypothetical protein
MFSFCTFLLQDCSNGGGDSGGEISRDAFAETVEVASVRSPGGLSIVSMAGLQCVLAFSADTRRMAFVPLGGMMYGVAIRQCCLLLFFFTYIKYLTMLSCIQIFFLLPSVA